MNELVNGDGLRIPLADRSVHMIATSPPFWGLRDYDVPGQLGLEVVPDCLAWARGESPCGACYVCQMRAVAAELWRVLRDNGTFWLNLGDSYTGSGKGGNPDAGKQATNKGSQSIGVLYGKAGETARQAAVTNVSRRATAELGMKTKDLCGIPWRVALALQADGWYLRSDIIWAKPNPMPESVTDRPTKSHEYVFLLAKSKQYFYDAEAVRESLADGRNGTGRHTQGTNGSKYFRDGLPDTAQPDKPSWYRAKAFVNPSSG